MFRLPILFRQPENTNETQKILKPKISGFVFGGVRGIRTLDPGFSPDAPLAGVCLQPLSHYSKCVKLGIMQ